MKKIVVSILALFYLSSSSGITVHLHYCMDKMINWSLLNSEGDGCGICGMQKDGGCCKDESKIVKNTSDQQATEFSVQLAKPAVSSESFVIIPLIVGRYFSGSKSFQSDQSPPCNGEYPIYILNCVFRI